MKKVVTILLMLTSFLALVHARGYKLTATDFNYEVKGDWLFFHFKYPENVEELNGTLEGEVVMYTSTTVYLIRWTVSGDSVEATLYLNNVPVNVTYLIKVRGSEVIIGVPLYRPGVPTPTTWVSVAAWAEFRGS